jgi:hypothetical protein
MNSLRTITGKQRTGTRRRKRFSFFVFLSFLIHAALILFLAIVFARKLVKNEAPEPPPPELILEITPPEKKDRPFIEAKEVSEKAPENAPFQSDQNTKAASELPPEGSLPLPSQNGVAQTAMELRNQKHTAGEKPAIQAGNPSQPQPPSEAQTKATQAAPEKTASTPPSATPMPTATPLTPLIPNTIPPPNNVKLFEPPERLPTPKTAMRETPPPTSPASPQRQASAPGISGAIRGYQPETRQTVIRGNISNQGRSSVAAAATPIGRYRKAVTDAIGSRWYYYVGERMGLLNIGTVDVSFKVSSTGKVSGLKVIRSNSNESLTDCSVRSIMDAKLPPIPPEVAATLQDSCLEIDYSFTIY